jgi:DNA-binding NtrC family response regulator
VAGLPERLTALLVDDDAAWRAALGGWLEGEGVRVVRLTRGEWVTSAIETHHADVVLLDVHLPGLDGLQVLESIRARWPKLPVIVMTAFGGPDLADRILRGGATAFLDKPFRMSELMTVLERATERGEAPWHGR